MRITALNSGQYSRAARRQASRSLATWLLVIFIVLPPLFMVVLFSCWPFSVNTFHSAFFNAPDGQRLLVVPHSGGICAFIPRGVCHVFRFSRPCPGGRAGCPAHPAQGDGRGVAELVSVWCSRGVNEEAVKRAWCVPVLAASGGSCRFRGRAWLANAYGNFPEAGDVEGDGDPVSRLHFAHSHSRAAVMGFVYATA